mmetsp:Transcript_168035/g.534535  ORF Transcript_168035/g.534535 Transcript_168035/m.534535 type:complete len:82 (-) Transcript_168035:104-349(-)
MQSKLVLAALAVVVAILAVLVFQGVYNVPFMKLARQSRPRPVVAVPETLLEHEFIAFSASMSSVSGVIACLCGVDSGRTQF